MNQAIEDWKNRCEYSHRCTAYHKLNFECALDQSTCVLYPMMVRLDERATLVKGMLEQIAEKDDRINDFGGSDGTAYLG